MRIRINNLKRVLLVSVLAMAGALTVTVSSGCVYKINIRQGNFINDEDVEKVQPGWTRSQVRFLLGTPMVADVFHDGRWDYVFYFKRGKERTAAKRHVIVYFDGDTVSRVDKDAPIDQS